VVVDRGNNITKTMVGDDDDDDDDGQISFIVA